jgi:hypothetical protein
VEVEGPIGEDDLLPHAAMQTPRTKTKRTCFIATTPRSMACALPCRLFTSAQATTVKDGGRRCEDESSARLGPGWFAERAPRGCAHNASRGSAVAPLCQAREGPRSRLVRASSMRAPVATSG